MDSKTAEIGSKLEVKAPEAPTSDTRGQHFYFMSVSTELDKALLEAKAQDLKVLGWKRTKSPVNPSKNSPFAYSVKQERFVLKCMAKKE